MDRLGNSYNDAEKVEKLLDNKKWLETKYMEFSLMIEKAEKYRSGKYDGDFT